MVSTRQLLTGISCAPTQKPVILTRFRSWEIGTETEALLEYEWSRLSVANPHIFPLPNTLPANYNASDVLNIAENVVANMPPNATTLIDGDGAAGDPASTFSCCSCFFLYQLIMILIFDRTSIFICRPWHGGFVEKLDSP